MASLNRTPLHLLPLRPWLCRPGFEGSQRHESPSWVELGLHNRNSGGHLQGHRAPHLQLFSSHLVHPNVLNTPGQTWSDPEQGSEDNDRFPSKGHSVPLQSRDCCPPPEGALITLFSAVLCQRPPTNASQSSYGHLTSRLPPPQGHPPVFIPPYLMRPQCPSSHLWWRAWRMRLPLGQTPLTMSDDWVDRPVSGTLQVLMATPSHRNPVEQLLLRSCEEPFNSSYLATVQGSRFTATPWPGPMTPPAPIATPPTTRWPISSAALLIPRT